jgi:hypothetical protein
MMGFFVFLPQTGQDIFEDNVEECNFCIQKAKGSATTRNLWPVVVADYTIFFLIVKSFLYF